MQERTVRLPFGETEILISGAYTPRLKSNNYYIPDELPDFEPESVTIFGLDVSDEMFRMYREIAGFVDGELEKVRYIDWLISENWDDVVRQLEE